MALLLLVSLNALVCALAVQARLETLIALALNKATSVLIVVRAGTKISLQLTTKSIKMSQWKQLS